MVDIFIITPCLNAAETIDDTIGSIISQFGNFHLHYHVQDGGSSDATIPKLERWQQRISHLEELRWDKRITFSFTSEPDSGLYDAISHAVARLNISPTSFMGWLNADDILWPGALNAIARLGEEMYEVEWILGWPGWIDTLGRYLHINKNARYPQELISAGLCDGQAWPFIQQESCFWRKSLWDKAKGINSNMRLAGDWDLWRRFADHAPLVHVQRQLGAFRPRPGQLSGDLMSYRSEIEKITPSHHRKKKLWQILKNEHIPPSIITAEENAENGKWELIKKEETRKRKKIVWATLRKCSTQHLYDKLSKHLW